MEFYPAQTFIVVYGGFIFRLQVSSGQGSSRLQGLRFKAFKHLDRYLHPHVYTYVGGQELGSRVLEGGI